MLYLQLHLSHVLGPQTYPLNQEETFIPPHLPLSQLVASTPSPSVQDPQHHRTITIAKGYTIINTLTTIGAF
ncbi:hypothetical protein ACSQ67_008408 [Phaseolus vulgaris]